MNQNIIFELKEEHKKIIEALNEVNLDGDIEEIKTLIQKMQGVVVEHLRKEDTLIYPALLHSDNEALVSLGKNFLDSMVSYSEMFIDVTKRILESLDAFDAELKNDYKKMCDRIKDRIFVEEAALFPAYESIR